MEQTPTQRPLDIFSPGFGLAMVGVGLLALAAVEGTGIFLSSGVNASTATAASDGWIRSDAAMESLGSYTASNATFEPTLLLEPQSAVGTGPGAPRSTPRNAAPPASGSLVGIAANPIPNGTAVYRLWSSGRVEAMITTEENVWSQWVPVAPGQTTDMRRPLSKSDNPDTNP